MIYITKDNNLTSEGQEPSSMSVFSLQDFFSQLQIVYGRHNRICKNTILCI